MRLLLYADPHWSVNSSIVRSRGEKYSKRLENLIQTLTWSEQLAVDKHCDSIVCLGDFFDTPLLNSEEITALQEVQWAGCPHYYLAGNHEMGRADQTFSAATIFDLCPLSAAITKPTAIPIFERDTRIVCLPYILERDRKPLEEYLKDVLGTLEYDNIIVLSHNDIAGMQLGKFTSTEGFSIEEIQNFCKLFVNGHLHNNSVVARGVVNLGNITGQNFSEDATIYKHVVMILDTITHEVEFIENPYSLKFYKLDFVGKSSAEALTDLELLQAPAVVTVRTDSSNDADVRSWLGSSTSVIESRVILTVTTNVEKCDAPEAVQKSDHLQRFVEYIRNTVGTESDIESELQAICGGLV